MNLSNSSRIFVLLAALAAGECMSRFIELLEHVDLFANPAVAATGSAREPLTFGDEPRMSSIYLDAF